MQQAAQAAEISKAAHDVLMKIASLVASSEAIPLDELVLCLSFRLCALVLDGAVYSGFAAPCAGESVDVALGFLRCQQSGFARLSMASVAEETLKSLGDLLQTIADFRRKSVYQMGYNLSVIK